MAITELSFCRTRRRLDHRRPRPRRVRQSTARKIYVTAVASGRRTSWWCGNTDKSGGPRPSSPSSCRDYPGVTVERLEHAGDQGSDTLRSAFENVRIPGQSGMAAWIQGGTGGLPVMER